MKNPSVNYIPPARIGARIEHDTDNVPTLCPTQGSNANFGVCIGSAGLFRYQDVGIGTAKCLCWGSRDRYDSLT